jgi:hypothetical protein
MNGKEIVKLSVDLASGLITEEYIKRIYGSNVLSLVLGIGAGAIAGTVVNSLLNSLDKETGIVSDIGSLVDDVFSIFD